MTKQINLATKPIRKTLSSSNVFFKSIIGPNTMKASKEPLLKVLENDAAIKASASEQREKINPSPIIVRLA
nr:hypothetical protein [Brevibacillus laterosporus]